MKKLLSILLGAGLFISTSLAHAELLKNLKFDGSLEVQAFALDDADIDKSVNDKESEVRTRVMLGSSFDLVEDEVGARVTVTKNNRLHGGTGNNSGEDAQTVQNNIEFAEAYVKLSKLFGSLDATVGRQFYGQKNDLVIYYGPVDDNELIINSLDIARIDTDVKYLGRLTAIAGKVAENGGAAADADTDLLGLNISNEELLKALGVKLGLYGYERNINSVGGAFEGGGDLNDRLYVYGLKASGRLLDLIDYDAEYAMNAGRDDNAGAATADPAYTGTAFVANAGLKFLESFNAKLGYAQGSGNDTNTASENEAFTPVNSDIRYGEVYGKISPNGNSAFTGGAGIADLVILHGGVGYEPKDSKYAANLHYYRFWEEQTNGSGSGWGDELDVIATWKHSENVGLRASYGIFWPDDDFGGLNRSSAERYGVNLDIRFGGEKS